MVIDETATDAWGIAAGYHSIDGKWHPTTDDTRQRLQTALGADPDHTQPPDGSPMWFITERSCPTINHPALIVLEDGVQVAVAETIPPDLPVGYHDLHPADGGPTTRLIVTPSACPDPPWPRAWGIATQLYAARSSKSWGIGDFADLAGLGRAATRSGAAAVAVNPFHAPLPSAQHDPSPYFPSSRRYRNPLYISVDQVRGAEMAAEEVERAAQAGRTLLANPLIDRHRAWAIKIRALEAIWDVLDKTLGCSAGPAFDAYTRREGDALARFCLFNSLAETNSGPWPSWPIGMRHPDGHDIGAFTAEHHRRIRFHMWLQFLLDEQLAAASTETVLIHDLAVGVDPHGADAWADQEVFALDLSVGAPPDPFCADGQNWGVPPFRPWRLRSELYKPLIDVLRSNFRHGGGLRIDHVMGLFRLFCRPRDRSDIDGAYVHFPQNELCDIVAIEAHRAGAFVIGEDLGTVEPAVREALATRRMLSYRVAMFESQPITSLPEQALATLTTHDLATTAGLWSGSDSADRAAAGLAVVEGAEAEARGRVAQCAEVDADATISVDELLVRAHTGIGRAPSRLVLATIEDLVGVRQRVNLPGTTTEWPNWSMALPEPIDDLLDRDSVRRNTQALATTRPFTRRSFGADEAY